MHRLQALHVVVLSIGFALPDGNGVVAQDAPTSQSPATKQEERGELNAVPMVLEGLPAVQLGGRGLVVLSRDSDGHAIIRLEPDEKGALVVWKRDVPRIRPDVTLDPGQGYWYAVQVSADGNYVAWSWGASNHRTTYGFFDAVTKKFLNPPQQDWAGSCYFSSLADTYVVNKLVGGKRQFCHMDMRSLVQNPAFQTEELVGVDSQQITSRDGLLVRFAVWPGAASWFLLPQVQFTLEGRVQKQRHYVLDHKSELGTSLSWITMNKDGTMLANEDGIWALDLVGAINDFNTKADVTMSRDDLKKIEAEVHTRYKPQRILNTELAVDLRPSKELDGHKMTGTVVGPYVCRGWSPNGRTTLFEGTYARCPRTDGISSTFQEIIDKWAKNALVVYDDKGAVVMRVPREAKPENDPCDVQWLDDESLVAYDKGSKALITIHVPTGVRKTILSNVTLLVVSGSSSRDTR